MIPPRPGANTCAAALVRSGLQDGSVARSHARGIYVLLQVCQPLFQHIVDARLVPTLLFAVRLRQSDKIGGAQYLSLKRDAQLTT